MAERSPIFSLPTAALVSLLVGGLGLTVWLFPAPAQARDSDGSRLGAEPHELGTTHKDTLEPPEDVADWRYVKIEKTRTVSFSVEVEPADSVIGLTLTRATGDKLDSIRTEEGAGEFTRELEPGLYYVKIGASASISYVLTIE